jgi:hypothetical protein
VNLALLKTFTVPSGLVSQTSRSDITATWGTSPINRRRHLTSSAHRKSLGHSLLTPFSAQDPGVLEVLDAAVGDMQAVYLDAAGRCPMSRSWVPVEIGGTLHFR